MIRIVVFLFTQTTAQDDFRLGIDQFFTQRIPIHLVQTVNLLFAYHATQHWSIISPSVASQKQYKAAHRAALYWFLVNRSLAFEDFLTVIRKIRLVSLPQRYLHILVHMHRITIPLAKFFGKADLPAVIKSDPPLVKELVMVGAEQESIVHIQPFSCVAL